MPKYLVIVNDEQMVGLEDEPTLEEAEFDIGELLRSGYYEVESVTLLEEGE